jgi:hypothetical protein
MRLVSDIITFSLCGSEAYPGFALRNSLKSTTMFPLWISIMVPGRPMIESGCLRCTPEIWICAWDGSLITEKGGAVLSASCTRIESDCVEESFDSLRLSSSIEKSKSKLLFILGGSDTKSSPLSYCEVLITSPRGGVLSGITNSSFRSVLSVSIDKF